MFTKTQTRNLCIYICYGYEEAASGQADLEYDQTLCEISILLLFCLG